MAEMCGNAARCVARLAYLKGIAGNPMCWETIAGVISAEVNDDLIKVKLTEPSAVETGVTIAADGQTYLLDSVDTGVPHAVAFVDAIDDYDVTSHGRRIRHHSRFAPRGTNADFATVLDKHTMKVRTYERGVEEETLACGTGACATGVAGILNGFVKSPVTVHLTGGDLTIEWEGEGKSVFMTGPAAEVFEGEINV